MRLRLFSTISFGFGEPLADDQFAYQYYAESSGIPRHLIFVCPNGRSLRPGHRSICSIPIHQAAPMENPKRWAWDGNLESPTITPSIGCDQRCGWHGNITAGERTP